MRVRWLTRYGPEGASSRYRVWQFLEPLSERGIRSEATRLARWNAGRFEAAVSVIRRMGSLLRRPETDVLVVQKAPIMPPQLWPVARRALRRVDTPIVWDLDDAIWANSDGERRMAEGMAQTADVVVAGNDLIAQWALAAGARRVTTIPTCFSPPRPVERPSAGAGHHVVWIGSPSTAELLAAEAHRLEEIMSVHGVRLTMIGGEPPASLRHLSIEVLPWSAETEHEQLARADFGLALQRRSEFADHKCGFKIIQYMAYGVIPIATDNEVHSQILGGLGHLVSPDTDPESVTEWIGSGVSDLDRDAVRRRWQESYSTGVGVEAWAALLGEVST